MGKKSSSLFRNRGRGGEHMSSARRRMLLWTLPVTLMLLSGLFFAGLVFANLTLNGFGIDSDDNTSPQIALYSGLSDNAPSNDWAAGPDAGSGVFELSSFSPSYRGSRLLRL